MAKRKASGKSQRSSGRSNARKTVKSVKRQKTAPAGGRKLAKKAASKAAKARPKSAKVKAKPEKARKKANVRSSAKTTAKKVTPQRRAAAKKVTSKSTKSVVRPKQPVRETDTADFTLQTPPSSLNLNRRGSSVRTGRAEVAEAMADHATLTPSITGGDVDANVEDAYFTGDEAPGGDNPTPDQDVVDEIGRALGVEYQDNEELRGSDKVADRDKHRWELDPASAEDYRDRK